MLLSLCKTSILATMSTLFVSPLGDARNGPQPISQYIIAHLAISPSKQDRQPGALLKVLPTGWISLHHCPSGMPLQGL